MPTAVQILADFKWFKLHSWELTWISNQDATAQKWYVLYKFVYIVFEATDYHAVFVWTNSDINY